MNCADHNPSGERLRTASQLIIAALVSVAVTACAPKKPVEAANVEKAAWKWEGFPLADTLPVARVDARVQAELSTRFYAPGNGQLTVNVDHANGLVEKDRLWAVFSPETLKLDEEMLEARRAALKMRWETLNQVDIPQKRLEVEKRLREARRLQELTKRFGANDAAWESLAELMPEAGLDEADRSPAAIDRTVEILVQQLAFLSGEKGGGASQELQVAEVELRQAEIDLGLKRKQYEMRMPFDGRLVCNLDIQKEVESYPVTNGQLIGVARKEDVLTCEVRMQDSRWLALPPEALFLKLKLADGGELKLPYAGRRIREEMRVEVLHYVFSVPAAAVPSLRRSIDSVLPAELSLQLTRPARIVSKMSLLSARPTAFGSAAWARGVSEVWPHAKVSAVGTSMVAIEPDPVSGQ